MNKLITSFLIMLFVVSCAHREENSFFSFRKSEFETKREELELKNMDRVLINMDIFNNDYRLGVEEINNFEFKLKYYTKKESLIEMKKYDNMGNKDSPISLKFVKYLIDSNSNSGLTNLITVIGNKFYIENDFENISKISRIELSQKKYSKSWQISIIKE